MLILLPAYLSENSPQAYFAPIIREYIAQIDHYVVENQKTARKVIKFFLPEKAQPELHLYDFTKEHSTADIAPVLSLLKNGEKVALLSEAGLPCIADPGAKLVAWCHAQNIQVVPVNGPSSIILALIASGFNGQEFSFHGYIPIEKSERRKKILAMEQHALRGATQLFMETPYRNKTLLVELVNTLQPSTHLCVAANINAGTQENIQTKKISDWKKALPDLHKIPALFAIGQPQR